MHADARIGTSGHTFTGGSAAGRPEGRGGGTLMLYYPLLTPLRVEPPRRRGSSTGARPA